MLRMEWKDLFIFSKAVQNVEQFNILDLRPFNANFKFNANSVSCV